jgi:DNA-binding transcriptional ArsR family regulator
MYGTGGRQAGTHHSPAALKELLGSARAGQLMALETPASPTEPAGRLGVTASAVNQHLRAPRDGGLLTRARHGRSVLCLRSELGDALVGGAEPVP